MGAASRFVKIEELNKYQLVEASIGKVAHIFQNREIRIQVATQNKIGTSKWVEYAANIRNPIRNPPQPNTRSTQSFQPKGTPGTHNKLTNKIPPEKKPGKPGMQLNNNFSSLNLKKQA